MKKLATRLAILAMFGVIVGCAITDYPGWANHKTTAEAKLWYYYEISFSGFAPDLDGTYAYTVKYDNTTGVMNTVINSYRNPIVSSWTSDGQINIDGDDVQGNGGVLGGKFLPMFISRDYDADNCGFFDNITYDHSVSGVAAALCFTGAGYGVPENDKNWDLHAAFTDLDQFMKSIWYDATPNPFVLDIGAVRINGTNYWTNDLGITVNHQGRTPTHVTLMNGPGVQQAIQAILNNTGHFEPVQFGFQAMGGMTVDLPNGVNAGFNHAVLNGLVQPSNNTGGRPFSPRVF